MKHHRIYSMSLGSVYPYYVAKAEKKRRTKGEVDAVIEWLTGYDAKALAKVIADCADFETVFVEAPSMNPHAPRSPV